MREKVHKIHSLPEDSPWDRPVPPVGSTEHPLSVRSLDRVMAVQRPLVVAHIRSIRRRHPDANPEQIVRALEARYLAAVTAGGAAVGATAVVPGIGTGVTLAIARVIGETAPLLVTVGTTTNFNINPFDGRMQTLPVFAYYSYATPGIPREAFTERMWAAVLTLMLIVMALNLIARLISKFFAPKTGR